MECWGADLIGIVTGYDKDEGERIRIPSYRGKQYILVVVDHYTRYTFVRTLRDKSEATQELMYLINLQQNITKKKLLRLHTDNGGEFINKELEQFLLSNGTESTTTVAGTSEHNSIVERKNRTLQEIARGLLLRAEAPEELWCEAIELAAVIHNNICQASIDYKIPSVLMSGKKRLQFDISQLATFGCNAYVSKPTNQRGHFQSSIEEGIYVGYDWATNSSKILMLKTMKVRHERSVIFHEDKFQFLRIAKGNIQVEAHNAMVDSSNRHNNLYEVKKIEAMIYLLGIPWYIVYWKGYKQPGIVTPKSMDDQVPDLVREYKDRMNMLMQQAVLKRPDLAGKMKTNKGPRRVKIANTTTIIKGEDQQSVNDYILPRSYDDAVYRHPDKEKWKEAIDKEMDSLLSHEVGHLTTLPNGKKAIGSKWVFAIKRDKDNKIIKWKARLVVQGFSQTYGVDYFDTFAPTVRYKSIKWLLALAAQHDLEIKQIDFDTAFLNAELKEEVYMKLPPGYFPKGYTKETVWRLLRALYGLKQAPREWWKKLGKALNELGYYASELDESVYMKIVDDKRIYLTLYVDDTLAFYPKSVESIWLQDKARIAAQFPIKDLQDCEWILNMSVQRDRVNHTLTLSQASYVDLILAGHNVEVSRDFHTPFIQDDLTCTPDPSDTEGNRPLNEREHTEYRQIIGELIYAACITRIDLSYITSLLSRFSSQPYVFHMKGAKRVLNYLQHHSTYKLEFRRDPAQDKEYTIYVYTDSNWASESGDRKSTGGWISSFNGTPVAWQSIKQKTVALSSTEAEYYTLVDAAKEALHIRQWFKIYTGKIPYIKLLGDNQGSLYLADHSTDHNRTKHIDIKHHFIREHVAKQEFELSYINTKEQLADILTKPLARIRFEFLINKLMKSDNLSLTPATTL